MAMTATVTANLRTALDHLPSGNDTLDLNDFELLEILRVCSAGMKRLEGLSAWAAGAFDRRVTEGTVDSALTDDLGSSNTPQLLRELTGMPYRQANDIVKLGRQVLPSTRSTGNDGSRSHNLGDALACGDLNAGAAKLIMDTMTHAHHAEPEKVMELEEQLVSLAVTSDTKPGMHEDDLRKLCSGVRKELDLTCPTQQDRNAVDKRFFNVGQEKDGLVAIRGLILPEVAATLEATLNALTSPRNGTRPRTLIADSDLDAANDQKPPQLGRTAAQKRHDALTQVINTAAAAKELPTHGGAPITVLIQTSSENLEQRRPGTLHTNNGPVKISAPAVEHAACSGSIQFYAQDPRGRLVALGNQQRVFTSNQRRAIIARDGGCVIPGCDTPPSWCEIHHVKPHARGGQTHTDNGVALCPYHHRHIEHNGWQVRMKQGYPQIRAPQWKDPTGTWYWSQPQHQAEVTFYRRA